MSTPIDSSYCDTSSRSLESRAQFSPETRSYSSWRIVHRWQSFQVWLCFMCLFCASISLLELTISIHLASIRRITYRIGVQRWQCICYPRVELPHLLPRVHILVITEHFKVTWLPPVTYIITYRHLWEAYASC